MSSTPSHCYGCNVYAFQTAKQQMTMQKKKRMIVKEKTGRLGTGRWVIFIVVQIAATQILPSNMWPTGKYHSKKNNNNNTIIDSECTFKLYFI